MAIIQLTIDPTWPGRESDMLPQMVWWRLEVIWPYGFPPDFDAWFMGYFR